MPSAPGLLLCVCLCRPRLGLRPAAAAAAARAPSGAAWFRQTSSSVAATSPLQHKPLRRPLPLQLSAPPRRPAPTRPVRAAGISAARSPRSGPSCQPVALLPSPTTGAVLFASAAGGNVLVSADSVAAPPKKTSGVPSERCRPLCRLLSPPSPPLLLPGNELCLALPAVAACPHGGVFPLCKSAPAKVRLPRCQLLAVEGGWLSGCTQPWGKVALPTSQPLFSVNTQTAAASPSPSPKSPSPVPKVPGGLVKAAPSGH